MQLSVPAHPILSLTEAAARETAVLGGDEIRIWDTMRKAGRCIADIVEREYPIYQDWPSAARILILAGPGHNAGDACLAARGLLDRHPLATATLILAQPVETLRALAKRALDELKTTDRLTVHAWSNSTAEALDSKTFDLVIDGLFGMGVRLPLKESYSQLITWINAHPKAGLRLAVDLPSGLGGEAGASIFQADITVMTGIAKTPVVEPSAAVHCGRLHYADLGFFDQDAPASSLRYILPNAHRVLNRLRRGNLHKHTAGHVAVLGGSRPMPGAVMMALQGALYGGAGLVTGLIPEALGMRLASGLPEAMWQTLPTRPEGSLESDAVRMIHQILERASALVIGPGLLVDKVSLFNVCRVVRESTVPLVIDASALTPDIISAAMGRSKESGPVVITPHPGEFNRLLLRQQGEPSREEFTAYCKRYRVCGLLKGPVSTLTDGDDIRLIQAGGPILARGGSGDILAGLIGALLAEGGRSAFDVLQLAVAWQGAAADHWARRSGERSGRTTDFLQHLAPVLRGEE